MSFEILIAEDNALNRKVLMAFIDQLGHSATVAEDGYEVLELMKDSSFDVILMDLRMPGIDGVETAGAVRQLDIPQPYIIAVTASAMSDDYAQFDRVGIDDILVKPVSIRELEAALDRMPTAA